MYFYQRVQHLVDHAADYLIKKVNWWMPSVAVGMALSVFLLGGPEAPAMAGAIVLPSLSPVVTAPPFATPVVDGPAPEEDGNDEVF